MRNLHVLLLPSWYPTRELPLNGIFFKEQAESLVQLGLKVGVLYPDLRSLRQLNTRSLRENHYQISRAEENGVIVYRQAAWNIPAKLAKGRYQTFLTRQLYSRYVREVGEPDVLHVHGALWAGIAAMDLKRRYKLPYVITEHSSAFARGLLSRYETHTARAVFSHAAASVAVSNAFAQLLRAQLGIEDIEVIPNMVDTDFFSCKERTKKAEGPFIFLTVAFLTPNKGIDVLLKAFAAKFRGNPEVRLEIGGDGKQRAELERLSRHLGISNQVTFLGKLNRFEVREAMCRSSVFVLPSHYETFGVVLIEAMSTGTPVISTRSGGPEEIVNEDSGLLVEPNNVVALSQAMRSVTQRKFDNKRIREYVVSTYSKNVVPVRLLNIYLRAMERNVV